MKERFSRGAVVQKRPSRRDVHTELSKYFKLRSKEVAHLTYVSKPFVYAFLAIILVVKSISSRDTFKHGLILGLLSTLIYNKFIAIYIINNYNIYIITSNKYENEIFNERSIDFSFNESRCRYQRMLFWFCFCFLSLLYTN